MSVEAGSAASTSRFFAPRLMFVAASSLGSFLLFVVEPLAAKWILPIFGGSPVVWSASLLFFQSALLLGYWYAHASYRRFGFWIQPKIHLALAIVALLCLPLRLPQFLISTYERALAGSPGNLAANPALMTFLILAVSVGGPFLVLSAGAPLVQKWFSETRDPAAKNPYFLYAASNVGSLIALLGFPVVIEPWFSARTASILWSVFYGVLVVCLAVCARVAWAEGRPVWAHTETAEEHASWRQRLTWMALSAGPSAALVGATAYLTTNIAPMPLLWVAPLSLYLVTFIIAFSDSVRIPEGLLRFLAPFAAFVAIAMFAQGVTGPIQRVLPIHLACFFVVALACHTKLRSVRPAAGRLTDFYLWIAVGGAVGGLFSSIVAPLAFPDMYEFPLAMAFSAAVVALVAHGAPSLGRLAKYAVFACGLVAVLAYARMTWHGDSARIKWVWMVCASGAVLVTMRRPWPNAAAISAFVVAILLTQYAGYKKPMFMSRGFFGVHRVYAMGIAGYVHRFVHGGTTHGAQDSRHPRAALTYYGLQSAPGRLFTTLPSDPRMRQVGLVGLGIGTLAAYGKPGAHMDFYELDPEVVAIAENPRYFTYLRDCRAKYRILLGDARLRLREAPDHGYGFLVLDAFAGDSIPIHLLTSEGFDLYLSKLQPHGLITVHISNRYLHLEPLLAAMARAKGLQEWVVDGKGGVAAGNPPDTFDSHWMVLAQSPSDLAAAKGAPWLTPYTGPILSRPWTDDFSNVLSALDL